MSAAGVNVFRTDIQGIRALAVVAVLIYHIWPTWLPGGYVGVDVFFVLSGYLITGLLVREIEKSGDINLRNFYARRIRRLLPASAVVLFAVAAATVTWMPVADWSGVARELVASAFYLQNLLLVGQQVDYLAVDAAPGPLLHFWSLAVEEQFYIFWPLVMLAVAKVARSRSWPLRSALFIALGGISLLSLAHGVHMSFVNPAPGYFLTTTRIWELGAGSLLAIATAGSGLAASGKSRPVFAWAGLLAIAVSAVIYSNRLPFPGYEALLPTGGTAFLIYASAGRETAVGRGLASSPMQYLGGISYSLYLWHWPLVVFYPLVTGRQTDTLQDGVLIVAVSVLCADLSRRLVEERFRHPQSTEVLRPFVIATALMMGVAISSLIISKESTKRTETALMSAGSSQSYLGAMAVSLGQELPTGEEFIPAASVAKLDRGSAYGLDGSARCIVRLVGIEPTACAYGSPTSATRIFVVGDSHAAHWLPAMELIADRAGWEIVGLTKDSCILTKGLLAYSAGGAAREYLECRLWGESVLDQILREKPDLVILSHSPRHSPPGRPSGEGADVIAAGIVEMVDVLHDAGIKVAAIAHTPWQKARVPDCLLRPNSTSASCSTFEKRAIRSGSIGEAAARTRNLALIDLKPYFCGSNVCPVVIGGVLVYRDAHHLTATYVRTLAPVLEQKIREQL